MTEVSGRPIVLVAMSGRAFRQRGLITSPVRLADALDARAGTHFVGHI